MFKVHATQCVCVFSYILTAGALRFKEEKISRTKPKR